MRVLLTGLSGTGKSTLIAELRARGLTAFDADDDGFTSPTPSGRWSWDTTRIETLLSTHDPNLIFFAGCSDEQAHIPFNFRILLVTPEPVLIHRLRTRTTNPYGSTEAERHQILSDLATFEPLLRASADLILETTAPPSALADAVLKHINNA
jgi:shikimate kinase